VACLGNIAPTSYLLILHGPSPNASRNLTDIVIWTAVWQDVNLKHLRDISQDKDTFQDAIQEDFSSLVKNFILGHIPVQFDSEHDQETWDSVTILQKHQKI
jgi:hypothetical protein